MSRVQITLFGALEVTHGTDPPQRPPTQKVVSLLGYLIAHRMSAHSRASLVALLWSDLPLRQGRRMLSDALWRTRRLLMPPDATDSPLLQVERESVCFLLHDQSTLDTALFDSALNVLSDDSAADLDMELADLPTLTSTESEQLQIAVQLYRGDFLEECFDDWALVERERLRERYLRALQHLIAHYLAVGAYDQALQHALRLLHADPLREESHRVLMRCYWLLGRNADALRAYEQCASVLDNEMGIAPDDATLALYNQICQPHTSAKKQPQPSTITTTLPFVGRRAERAALLHAVEACIAGSGGVLLLTGDAGSGKTHLLREITAGANWRGAQVSMGVGREEARALPFGPLRQMLSEALTPQRRQQLHALDELSLHQLQALLDDHHDASQPHDSTSWSLHSGGASKQAQQLYDAITFTLLALGRLQPQVVILEDITWFDEATVEALESILPRLQQSSMLVILSSRPEELQHSDAIWQMLLRLDRSGRLSRVHLDTMPIEDCNELVRRALNMTQVAQRFSARLHNATDGNPFFLLETLRALQEQQLLIRDAAGGWHTPWDAPGSDYRDLPLATSLRQIIDARLQRLSAHDRAALAAAAVLGQQCTPAAWSRMVEDGLHTDELLRRQFLVEDHNGYRFGHETVRETVYTQLDQHERAQLHLRAAEALEHEHFAGVEALAQHFYRAGAWNKAQPYLVQSGDRAMAVCAYRDALQRYDQALEANNTLPAEEAALACCEIQLKRGEVAMVLGDYLTARAAYERVLALTDPVGRDAQRRRSRIYALNGMCAVLSLTNDFERAAAASRQARTLADAWPELRSRAATYYQAGVFCYHVDQYADAHIHLQQALGLYEAIESPEGQAHCLELLAWTWRRQEGVTDRVLASLQQAMAIYTHCGNEYRQRQCMVSLANVYLLRGSLDDVLIACDRVLPFFRATDARYTISECQYFRGAALFALGRYEEALQANSEAWAISVDLGIAAAAQVNQIFIGKELAALGRTDEAFQQFIQASASHDRLVRPRALAALAELSLAQGDLMESFTHLRQSIDLMRTVGSQPFLGMALRVLGQMRAVDQLQQLPQPTDALPAAEECLQQSIALLETACLYGELGLSWSAYGSFLFDNGRLPEAFVALNRAIDLIRQSGQTPAYTHVRELYQRCEAQLQQPHLRRHKLAVSVSLRSRTRP